MRSIKRKIAQLMATVMCISSFMQPISVSAANVTENFPVNEENNNGVEKENDQSFAQIQENTELNKETLEKLSISVVGNGKIFLSGDLETGYEEEINKPGLFVVELEENTLLHIEVMPDEGYEVALYKNLMDDGTVLEEEKNLSDIKKDITVGESSEIILEFAQTEETDEEEEQGDVTGEPSQEEQNAEEPQGEENSEESLTNIPNAIAVTPFATTQDESVNLIVGDLISWDNYRTRYYTLTDGNTVYCLQPLKKYPDAGEHKITETRDNTDMLTKALYYTYGGPGFNESGFNTGNFSSDYSMSHYLVSYIYNGCVIGPDAFGILSYQSVLKILKWYDKLQDLPAPPEDTVSLLFDTGHNSETGERSQVMGTLGWDVENGAIEIKKSSAAPEITQGNDCYSLAGAEYGVYEKGTDNKIATIVTDEKGYGRAEDIPTGEYEIKEIKAPKGYALDTTVGKVTVQADTTVTYSCSDKPQNDPVRIILGKIDRETNLNKPQGSASLENAEFTVKYYTGNYNVDPASIGKKPERAWILRTDSDGYCRLSEQYKISGDEFYKVGGIETLPLGTVTIQETKAPEGYLINSEIFVRQITSEGYAESVTTYNAPTIPEQVQKGIIRLQKVDAETGGKPSGEGSLKGAVYEVYDSTGAKVDTLTTDEEGKAQSKELPVGTYTVKETAASPGYVLDANTYTVVFNPDTTSTPLLYKDVTSRETPQKGIIRLQKVDKETGGKPSGDGTLKGAVYEVYNTAGKKVDTMTTDEAGTAQSKQLPLGSYTVKETKSSEGYIKDPETYKVTISAEQGGAEILYQDVTSRETPQKGIIKLEKEDAETGEAQGAASLKGAVYEIRNSKDEVVDTLTTDKKGKAKSKELPLGSYTVKETKPSPGYNVDQNTYTVKLTSENREDRVFYKTQKSKEEVIRGDVQIVKFGADGDGEDTDIKKPLKGIKFIFTSKTTGKKYTIVTDENGYANTQQLGNSRGGLPYDTYTVTEDSPYPDYAEISPFEVTITEEQKTLYYIIENDVIEAPVSVVKKDATTGKVIPVAGTKFQILDADKKVIEMTVSHYPHLIKQDTWETDETGSFMLPEKLRVGTYYLKEVQAPDGYLKGELLEFHVDGSYEWEKPIVVEYEDTPVMGNIKIQKKDETTGNAIAGAVFEISAAEDIVTPDGTIRVEKGKTVDTVTTDAAGVAVTKALYLGKYNVKETSPAPGFVLSDKTYKAEIKYKDQTTAVVTENLEITNKPTRVVIDKKVTGTEQRLSGVKFAIWNKDMKEGIDEGIAKIDTVLTDKNGQACIEYLLPGTYCVQEVEGIAGYAMDDKVRKFTVDKDGKIEGKGEITIVVENPKTEITKTMAVSLETDGQEGIAKTEARIKDTVDFKNLQVGAEVVIKGILMDKETGKPLLIDKKEVTAETRFIAEKSAQAVDNVFTLDASNLAGKEVVVFEKAYIGEIEIAAHEDLEDELQAVRFPKHAIGTTAMDKDTGKQQGIAKEQTTIVDKVKYSGLIVGQEYTVKGVLMDKGTGKEFLVDGKPVTAEKTFKAEKPEGSIELEFTFDSSALKGNAVVVFEHLYWQETEVAVHADIKDKGQTVEYPKHEIQTTAKDQETGHNQGIAGEQTTIIDKVTYTGLIVGEEYTVKGVLMDKGTGKEFLVDGKPVTAEKTFKAEKPEGSIELEFTFDSSALKGNAVVVFEHLYWQETEVAVHADIKDKDQTIEYPEHKIGTQAKNPENGEQTVPVKGKVTIVDTVSYVGLIPGETYLLKGVLMDKGTGSELLVNGKTVTAEKTFVPEKASGEVDVEFTFDTLLLAKKEIVVFERLYCQGKEVAVHTDINDRGQTIKVKDIGKITTSTPNNKHNGVKTGDEAPVMELAVIAVTSMGIVIVLWGRKRRKHAGEK